MCAGDQCIDALQTLATVVQQRDQLQSLARLQDQVARQEAALQALSARAEELQKQWAAADVLNAFALVAHEQTKLKVATDDLSSSVASRLQQLEAELQEVRIATGALKPVEDRGGTGGAGTGKVMNELQRIPGYGDGANGAWIFPKNGLTNFRQLSKNYMTWRIPRGGSYVLMATTASFQKGSSAFAKVISSWPSSAVVRVCKQDQVSFGTTDAKIP